MPTPTFSKLADLPVTIEAYALEDHRLQVSSGFERRSTTFRLHGKGETGVGEDVTYEADDHGRQQDLGPVLPLAGDWTLKTFGDHVGGLDTFPAQAPENDVFRAYRRWGIESAALDLALRQNGLSLPQALGRELAPVAFVMSMRLGGEPPTAERVTSRLALYPQLRFKLDATPDWSAGLIDELAATGAVAAIDFKGHYRGTIVDVDPSPELYERCKTAFPDAWLEDPWLEGPTGEALADAHDRVTWDAIIHSVADIEQLPFRPRCVNIKPSRFGSLEELMAAYDWCDANGVLAYGGGQFELAAGRGHIQYLASLFHADAPNDIAPLGYDAEPPAPGLPTSPLPPAPSDLGFRWGAAE